MYDDVQRACKVVAEKHNLSPDWINDGVKGFAVSVELQPERNFTASAQFWIRLVRGNCWRRNSCQVADPTKMIASS